MHPLFFKDYDEDEAPRISPYAIVGGGIYTFDPQAELNGQWYALQPLRLEGQGFNEYKDRKTYELTQFNLLGGLGLKYEINSFLNARLEFVHRKLFTDYLDDVSTEYVDPTLFANYLPANLAAVAQQLYTSLLLRNSYTAADKNWCRAMFLLPENNVAIQRTMTPSSLFSLRSA